MLYLLQCHHPADCFLEQSPHTKHLDYWLIDSVVFDLARPNLRRIGNVIMWSRELHVPPRELA